MGRLSRNKQSGRGWGARVRTELAARDMRGSDGTDDGTWSHGRRARLESLCGRLTEKGLELSLRRGLRVSRASL